ncbi:MAG: TetR/AcrR family transcriptional regulator [Desulfobacteria bacterium]
MKTEKGKLTRKSIVKKSLRLFSEKGYYNTSMVDIVQATGLTKGGIYGQFKSKEEIWHAVYDEAVNIWRSKVFKGTRDISNPIDRIERLIENILKNYIGAKVFKKGAFFVPMLFEFSGHSVNMTDDISRGFEGFSNLLYRWLKEAADAGLLKKGLNLEEIANFIFISLNGATSLFVATKNPNIWQHTIRQLEFYINQLKRG